MSQREHDLLQELRQARAALYRAREAEEAVRLQLSERKQERIKAQELVEEVIREIETGSTGRPILDHLATKQTAEPEEETADERQRGPTQKRQLAPKSEVDWKNVLLIDLLGDQSHAFKGIVYVCAKMIDDEVASNSFDLDLVAQWFTVGNLADWLSEGHDIDEIGLAPLDETYLRKSLIGFATKQGWPTDVRYPAGIPLVWMLRASDEAEDEEPAAHVHWTSEDLETELASACKPLGTVAPWKDVLASGCDDAKILTIVQTIWPWKQSSCKRAGSGSIGCEVIAAPTPAFWIGRRRSPDRKVAPPQLEGLQLADRIRTVLGIPRAKIVHEEPKPEKPRRTRRKMAAVSEWHVYARQSNGKRGALLGTARGHNTTEASQDAARQWPLRPWKLGDRLVDGRKTAEVKP